MAKPDLPFSFNLPSVTAKFNGQKATLILDGKDIGMPDCKDFGTYIGGGWLEEYAYLQLQSLVEEGAIWDLRIGMEIAPPGQRPGKKEMPFGEFDCVFTNGKRLFIVECKAGSVKQEHIQKLKTTSKPMAELLQKALL